MPASSTVFWTEIRPDPALRQWLLATGLVLALLGVPVILSLPLPTGLAGIVIAGWLAWNVRESALLLAAHRRCARFRLGSDGAVLVLGAGRVRAARLLPGCVILAELAWLRLRDEQGRTWSELVAGNHRESEEWRRFQVIIRHSRPC